MTTYHYSLPQSKQEEKLLLYNRLKKENSISEASLRKLTPRKIYAIPINK